MMQAECLKSVGERGVVPVGDPKGLLWLTLDGIKRKLGSRVQIDSVNKGKWKFLTDRGDHQWRPHSKAKQQA